MEYPGLGTEVVDGLAKLRDTMPGAECQMPPEA